VNPKCTATTPPPVAPSSLCWMKSRTAFTQRRSSHRDAPHQPLLPPWKP
jgi:hypothetical protein